MISPYWVTMRHDGGRARIKVVATSAEAAARTVCEAERAPLRAVVKVTRARPVKRVRP